MREDRHVILSLIDRHHQQLLAEWLACQKRDARFGDTHREVETAELAGRFLDRLRRGTIAQADDVQATEWQPLREVLEDLSRDRAIQGFEPRARPPSLFSR
jgi:hypothetical protein